MGGRGIFQRYLSPKIPPQNGDFDMIPLTSQLLCNGAEWRQFCARQARGNQRKTRIRPRTGSQTLRWGRAIRHQRPLPMCGCHCHPARRRHRLRFFVINNPPITPCSGLQGKIRRGHEPGEPAPQRSLGASKLFPSQTHPVVGPVAQGAQM